MQAHGLPAPQGGVSYADMLRRGIPAADIETEFGILAGESARGQGDRRSSTCSTRDICAAASNRSKRRKSWKKSGCRPTIDYEQIGGLRLEARQKLNKIRPDNLGQAGRISGVNPADIAVLMVYLASRK